jgi:hypothetical protein
MVWWFRKRSEPEKELVPVRLLEGRAEVPPDEDLAELKVAAEEGDRVAMANLAAGLHVKGDLAGALLWWERAWAAGNVVAGYNLVL